MYKQNIIIKSMITLFFACSIQVAGIFVFAAEPAIIPEKSDYPHWNFKNKETYSKLVKMNTFIENNKNKNLLAVFDWDGTLYNENIQEAINILLQ